jgi:hypothetical protein
MTDRAKKARPGVRAKFRARLKEKMTAFLADKEALYARQRDAGWRQAIEAEHTAKLTAAHHRHEAAMTVPTTTDGAVALLGFISEAYSSEQKSKIKNAPCGLGEYYPTCIAKNVSKFFKAS